MARFLLVGARGMLGRRLHETLGAAGDLVASGRTESEGVRVLDVTDAAAVDAAVCEVRPDWIVNASAYTAVDRAEDEQQAAFAVNAEGPEHLARAAARHGARLLHVSTDFVFDGEKESAYVETDATNAIGVYARSKEEGERRVAAQLPEAHAIVRVAWLYGPDGGNFVATMLRLGRERDRLGVVDDQHGTPTFTRDAAAAITAVIEADLRGVIHAANRGATTWCGLARRALELAGCATPVDGITTADYPTPARRPKNSALKNRVLEQTIGDPMRTWEDALTDYIAEMASP